MEELEHTEKIIAHVARFLEREVMKELTIMYHPLDALKYKMVKRFPRKYKKKLKNDATKTSH